MRQPRIRPRRQVNVAALVASPEERSSRPSLRLTIVGVIVLALFGVMVLRLWTLQVIDTKTYAAAVSANHLRSVVVPAPRGDIVDRTGHTALVDNAVFQEIVISAKLRTTLERPTPKTPLTQSQKTEIGKIATLVNLSTHQVDEAIENQQLGPYQSVPVLPNAPAATVQFLEAHQSEYPGISVQSSTQRSYPQGGTLATQTLGYTATSPKPGQQYLQVGEAGLEAEYNKYLTGTPGKQLLEVNAAGTVVGTVTQARPTQGDDLVTNLDLGLQQAVQSALDNDVTADSATVDTTTGQTPKPDNAAAVVLDVRTGAVLAMASYPTYDNNEWVGGISNANFAAIKAAQAEDNYAIQGQYTPGSTFKLITATAALQAGLITPDFVYDDTGTYTVPDCTGAQCVFHDDVGDDGGAVDVAGALTVSSDDFFYRLGVEFWDQRDTYGLTPIQNTAAQYGLNGPTGIDLPGESSSRVASPQERAELHKEAPSAYPDGEWNTGANLEMAFGQGETVVTPIGLADAYATFANGGTRYQPEVGAAVVNQSDKVVKTIAPKVTGHVTYAPANYQAILQGLIGVVNDSTGTANQTFQQDAFFPMGQYVIAGKTGTADTTDGSEPNAWFVSFGPNPNPQYAVAVVVNHGGYGAAAAAPAVAAIWNYLYTNPVPALQLPTAKHPVTNTPSPTNPPAAPATTTTTAPGASATATPTTAATGTG